MLLFGGQCRICVLPQATGSVVALENSVKMFNIVRFNTFKLLPAVRDLGTARS